MKHLLIIAISGLAVAAAYAKDFDQAAVPNATVSMQIASERCQARHAANDLKTYSELEACKLAAERAFATAIKLKRMQQSRLV